VPGRPASTDNTIGRSDRPWSALRVSDKVLVIGGSLRFHLCASVGDACAEDACQGRPASTQIWAFNGFLNLNSFRGQFRNEIGCAEGAIPHAGLAFTS